MSIQTSEQTSLTSYRLVFTGTGNDTFPTAFPLGVTSGDIDLHKPEWGGKGTETKANRLCMLFLSDKAYGSATIGLTGACEGGCEEPIASLALTAGTTVESGTNRWVDDITLTSYHLAEDAILVADKGNSQPTKFGFDAIGYRYINFYSTAFCTTTEIYVYARHF